MDRNDVARLFQNARHFTLHVRLTRGCNAHCTYCSSAGTTGQRMEPEAFERAITWIANHVLPRVGVNTSYTMTVEYLGGEVLIVPADELERNVATARRVLAPKVRVLRDGAQSNLIATPRRVERLATLFDGRLGTSWDTRTGQRTVGGSAELYTAILNRSLHHLETTQGLKPGRVLVVDAKTAPHLGAEVTQAASTGYDLVLRPAFLGGSPDVQQATLATLVDAYLDGLRAWMDAGGPDAGVRIEPYTSLWERRKESLANAHPATGCPFQSDCALRSLSLDPDGSLHICQEMADAGHFPLGNALEERFDESVWLRLAARTKHLDASCKACPWVAACGGGCMNEAVERFGDPFAKTELCAVWTAIFQKMDQTFARPDGQPLILEDA